MIFIVALYLPWCRYLGAQVGVQPQLYADNLKCVSRDPEVLLGAARFTTGYDRLVGQEPALSKCVLMSGWMFGILWVILIPLFMVGPLPWLLGFALSFLDWFLSAAGSSFYVCSWCFAWY